MNDVIRLKEKHIKQMADMQAIIVSKNEEIESLKKAGHAHYLFNRSAKAKFFKGDISKALIDFGKLIFVCWLFGVFALLASMPFILINSLT